jgi:hypothetical protein
VSEDVSVERLSVGEAARVLGVTRDAIHKRISRGSIEYEKGEDGRFYVYVDTSTLGLDPSTDTSKDESKVAALERLIATQGDRISFLERELERRGDETERLHQIVAGLTRATAELSSRLPEIEAPPEPPGTPETAAEPERAGPWSASGEAQEGTERPQQRSGWRAPVAKLPWWHYGLGILFVFLSTCLADALVWALVSVPVAIELALVFAIGWPPAGVFGLWVGFRQRDPHLRSGVIRFGVIVGLAVALGPLVYSLIWNSLIEEQTLEQVFAEMFVFPPLWLWPIYIAATVLPGWLLYVSGALIGNAWQRRRTGRISGTTPASPLSRTTLASPEPQAEWTPRSQAMLGFAGTVIAALISLIGTAVSVFAGSGG